MRESLIIPEREPLPKYPIFITGGAGATGRVIAERFAREGYPLIIGTRSQEKFDAVSARIQELGGAEPRPFIANITSPDEVAAAYKKLDLSVGEPIHFFSLAAEGIKGLSRAYGRLIIPLLKDMRARQLTEEKMLDATAKMKELVSNPESLQAGLAANFEGPRDLAIMLADHDHFHARSQIVTLSSSISHDTDPDNMESYGGPWFYVPVGLSKAKGVQALQDVAWELGIGMLDVVAPEIVGTEVADFLEGIMPLFQAVRPDNPIVFAKVTKEDVANAIYTELQKKKQGLVLERTAYVGEGGVPTTYVRPASWGSSEIPYL